MKIVFFQDMISMHFAVFLEQISNNHEVVLFVDESITQIKN